jgi:hypothetical protein
LIIKSEYTARALLPLCPFAFLAQAKVYCTRKGLLQRTELRFRSGLKATGDRKQTKMAAQQPGQHRNCCPTSKERAARPAVFIMI